MASETPKDKIRNQLKNLVEGRAAILSQSTFEKLKRLDSEVTRLQAELSEAERVENSAKHSIAPSSEETQAWAKIRELMEREAGILREKLIPEKFIRVDSQRHFSGDIEQRISDFEKRNAGLTFNQTHGPRVQSERQSLEAERQAFATKIKPLCIAGEKVASIRHEIAELSARRDALRLEREEKALAGVR